jgi:NAD(P)-dependent dehydrogenase (short-subunit alcohol dehydrogenase family)
MYPMKRTVLVTGADRGLGFALCVGLLDRGWHVFAGQYMPEWPELTELSARYPTSLHVVPLDVSEIESVQAAAQAVAGETDHIDLLINNAGIGAGRGGLREGLNWEAMRRAYDVNALGPLRVVDAFLPLMDQGEMKRLCFVSSEAGSIARSRRQAGFGYCMTKSALNMAVKIAFNRLRPEGYTFRLYHPGWMRTYMSGKKNTRADMEPEEAAEKAIPFFLVDWEDEDRFVLIDYAGEEWPF